MRKLETKPFPYYIGIHSLEELVTKESRVCVVNILGNESRKVTPVSHVYSGGNVVAGVQYGRRGSLETRLGPIPVYRSVLDAREHGHAFNIGVIYLPPMAVSQAVWELVRYNRDLQRIVIVTEKVPIRDSRNIRFICQDAGVDVIGANCLGVANAWDHVRVGGALGGDNPEETLCKGSVAVYSNSGNFTSTIAQYLKTGGFGVSTVVSSGKDVYIHFSLAEFLYSAQNDPRTRAVALYIEPGGYYEKQALDWISERRFGFNKPMVVCVTGRWKKDLQRACGHAGTLAGRGDDAESKEAWFDEYFDIDLFDPAKPRVGKKGVRVASIQHIPDAMKSVFKKMDEKTDFRGTGDLSLKLWIGDHFLTLPENLDIPIVKAIEPYNQHIEEINKQVGANFLRQNMRNKSGVSRIDAKTQIAELHQKSVLDLAKCLYEENVYYAIGRIMPGKIERRVVNVLLNYCLQKAPDTLETWNMADNDHCAPNAVIASQIALICREPVLSEISRYTSLMIDWIREFDSGLDTDSVPKELNEAISRNLYTTKPGSSVSEFESLVQEMKRLPKQSPVNKLTAAVFELADKQKTGLKNPEAFLLAGLSLSIFWKPLMEKRISRRIVEEAMTYILVLSRVTAYSVKNRVNNTFWKIWSAKPDKALNTSFTSNLFQMLFNRKPTDVEIIEFKYLLGLTITNGPGTLSAKGAKESISARNPVPMAFVGFLSNTGLAHGGNGFEAVDYLLDRFKDVNLTDPGKKDQTLNLHKMANETARAYAQYKAAQKETGKLAYKRIPCIGHPVFKGNAVNVDPREDFVSQQMKQQSIYNVFLEFYHLLVKELFKEGATANVFCVNVDAVLAVISLKLIWNDFRKAEIDMAGIQDLVFVLFILGRSIGIAAEVADHLDRGLDMDCRTPQREVGFIL